MPGLFEMLPFELLITLEDSAWMLALYWLAFLSSHYRIPVRYGPLDLILVSPGYHARHHEKGVGVRSGNFGQVLRIWDRLFRTVLPERSAGTPVVYGL